MKASSYQKKLKVIFLGTNGWYDTATGNTICILVRTDEYDIVFDAGYGLYKLGKYIADQDDKPVYLFLSHLHLDHIAGLHTLAKCRLSRGLTICVAQESRSALSILINQPYTVPLTELPYPVKIVELPLELSELPFRAETKQLVHSSLTLGYRIEVDGKVISYCPDTGYCSNAVDLSRNADLVIAECAYRSGKFNKSWPHLNPESAARIAKEAGVQRLALVHFDASTHPTLEARKDSEKSAQVIFLNTFATMDDMEVEV